MMRTIDRRAFFKTTVLSSAAIAAALSLEERALLSASAAGGQVLPASGGVLPTGRIGSITVSRIICGGNLIGGWAHSRDLLYVSPLLKRYFTDEKILETLELCEENGINTIITGTGSGPLLERYRKERGGRIQWIAQCVPSKDDLTGDVKKAVDGGAVGAFVIGNVGDEWSRAGRVDLIAKVLDFTKQNKIVAGVGGHNLGTPMACEKADLAPDFYLKTHHSTAYWSARRPDQQKDVIDNYAIDNYWDKNPEETAAFMRQVKRPWIAYKVLAAGAIHPRDGFAFAFKGGADFLCVGMFDFQIVEDVVVATSILVGKLDRDRPWCA